MGLARHEQLDGTVAGEQPEQPVAVADDERGALVGGEPAGEADDEQVRVEDLGGAAAPPR